MSKFSRSKGQRGEREVAELLQKHLQTEVKRELGAPRDGGCDIKITLNEITYFIEVMRVYVLHDLSFQISEDIALTTPPLEFRYFFTKGG